MQERIVKIVPRLSEEKLIEELLAANDEMNTAFTRFHRLIIFTVPTYLSTKQVDGSISAIKSVEVVGNSCGQLQHFD